MLKLESLISKTNRQFKKGERLDSISFLKLHRKRIGMLEMQEEAEGIVREGDLEFYRAWTDRVLDKPTHYNFIQFRLEIKELKESLHEALRYKEKGQIHTFFIDTAPTLRVVYKDLDNPDWREAVAHSPFFTKEQIENLLRKSDILQSLDKVRVGFFIREGYRRNMRLILTE